MSKYFTIGEMSKLFNLPIKTLRYYDQVGLLKPIYINPDNKYRYYSVEQFICIDVIKNCKLMGMSLDEIKKLLDTNTTVEDMCNTIKKQIDLLDEKIQQLYKVKDYMTRVEDSISDISKYDLNKVFIKYNKERKFKKYNYISNNQYELEVNLRKVVLDIESKMYGAYLLLGTEISYDEIIKNNKVMYKESILTLHQLYSLQSFKDDNI
ncbi:MAG: helix-turn-helix domain-containing protein [Romboutsia sp.]